jgi:S-adenosylmethionine synthetase
VLDERPDAIVHCAANRFPDSCTANPNEAAAINRTATGELAIRAQQRQTLLIYISTDYVFSGKCGEAPYKTTDPTNPPNVYGRTKAEGERAVLQATGGLDSTHGKAGSVFGLILRVPLLYGHCDEADPSKSAVHMLVDAIQKAQTLKKGDGKIKMDDFALKYPTATEDVGRVCVNAAKLYLVSPSEDNIEQLPRTLHYSAEQKFTKYEICKLFATEILGLPINNLEPWDPASEDGAHPTARPYDSHLDTSLLKDLGISVAPLNFEAWW